MKILMKIGFVACLLLSLISPYRIVFAETDAEPTGMTVIGEKGVSRYTRKVATSIGVYVKKGTVPGMRKFSGSWGGIKYNALEIDCSGKDGTFIQVDYAGHDTTDDRPKYLNNFYDKELTANDAYYWVGAINAGFFTNNSGSNMYGYPTGAVKKDGKEEQYRFTDGSDTWGTSPSYGTGFSTAHLNKDGTFELIYNGWKGGKFYKYNGDSDPNTWDYGNYLNFEDAVSGAYTLMVDGDSSIHWGKSDGSYWDYPGTCVTLFGQKDDGNYILLTTEGRISSNQEVALMDNLGCSNAIRFDGGGSTQMAFDSGMSLDHYYFTKTNKDIPVGQPLETSDIGFDLYMSDNTYHWASFKDAPQADIEIYNSHGELVNDLSKAPVGQYRLRILLNGLEQAINFNIVDVQKEITVTFTDYTGNIIHTQKIKEGEIPQCPIDMNRDGYIFDGWNLDLTTIKTDVTVNPLYTPIKYQLNLDLDGGVSNNPTTYTIEDEIKLNEPVKEGYIFTGWTIDNSEDKQMEVTIPKGSTGDKHFKANYEIATYNLTYRFEMTDVINNNPSSYTINDEIILNPPEAKGYKFIGWYLDDNPLPEGIIKAGSNGNKELYGEFEYISYIANFDVDNLSPITFNISNLPIELPIPQKEGKIFCGWYDNPEFNGNEYKSLTEIGNIDLYAKWENKTAQLVSLEVLDNVDNFYTGEIPTNDMFTVIGEYDDGSKIEIRDFTIDPITEFTIGDNVLTISYDSISIQHTINASEKPNDTEEDKSVELFANIASAYTVTLPKSVDITNEKSTFDVKVQGNIAISEKLNIVVFDTELTENVIDINNAHAPIPVEVTIGNAKEKSYSYLEIADELIDQITLSHEPLSSGNWTGSLLVKISLNKQN